MKKKSVVKQVIIFCSAMTIFMTVSLVASDTLDEQPKKESVTAVTPIEDTVAKQITDNNTIVPVDSELGSTQKYADAPAVTSPTFEEALEKNQKQVGAPTVEAVQSSKKLEEKPTLDILSQETSPPFGKAPGKNQKQDDVSSVESLPSEKVSEEKQRLDDTISAAPDQSEEILGKNQKQDDAPAVESTPSDKISDKKQGPNNTFSVAPAALSEKKPEQKQNNVSSEVSIPSKQESKTDQILGDVPLSTAMLLKAEKSADKSIDSDAVNPSKKPKVTDIQNIQSSEQFTELLNSKVPVLVDFFAAWSAPCDMINDSIISLASKADGKYKVVKVNADMNEELLKEHGVKTLPTVMLFRDGKEVDKKEGIQQESTYASMLSSK